MYQCKSCCKSFETESSCKRHYTVIHINGGGTNQFTKAKREGRSITFSASTREKLASVWRGRKHSEETKAKISKIVNEKIARGGWHYSLAKRYVRWYKGIRLHSSWELAYLKYLDTNGIPWRRVTETFKYTFENKVRQYTPDFYLR